jgi:hypothetical protein
MAAAASSSNVLSSAGGGELEQLPAISGGGELEQRPCTNAAAVSSSKTANAAEVNVFSRANVVKKRRRAVMYRRAARSFYDKHRWWYTIESLSVATLS